MNRLQHSPADILISCLESKDVFQNWGVYLSLEPSSPDNTVTFYDTLGITSGTYELPLPSGDRLTALRYGVAIRIRSQTFGAGYNKSLDIYSALMKLSKESVSKTNPDKSYVISSAAPDAPLYVGRDKPATHRCIFTINLTFTLDYDIAP